MIIKAQVPIRKLDSVSFDELLKQQNPFDGADGTFDLRGVEFISPAAMVQLAAACHNLDKNGCKPTIRLDNDNVLTYLMRAGFTRIVESVAQLQPPPPPLISRSFNRLHGSNPLLIEVTKIEAGSELPELLTRIVWTLRHRLKYRKADAFDVTIAISEAAQNCFDHNRQTCGFLAMQVYGAGAKRFLEIGIADCGDGIMTTLQRNSKNASLQSDLEAIKLATQIGTSEHDDSTRGTGLYHLLQIAYQYGGGVQIRSGRATVRYRMDKKQGWGYHPIAYMPGTQIALTLQAKIQS